MSCVSAAFCVAAGTVTNSAGVESGLVERWNGTSWATQPVPRQNRLALGSVSCVTVRFCEAIGRAGPAGGIAERWNGTSWTFQSRPVTAVDPDSVSCLSVTFCLSANGFDQVAIWNGTSWTAGRGGPELNGASSVSCASTHFCVVSGQIVPVTRGAIAMWNGHAWHTTRVPGPALATVDAVACAAVRSCEAAGSAAGRGSHVSLFGERWNGSRWIREPMPTPSRARWLTQMDAVSCPSRDWCAAVGQYDINTSGTAVLAFAEVWNGTAWTRRPIPSAG